MAADFSEPLTADQSNRFERAKLAMLTGWTLEYIDSLGVQDRFDIMQIYEVEQKLRQD